MSSWVKWSKYSGCGNDFLFFDGRTQPLPSIRQLLPLCDRVQSTGVGGGADGIIIVEQGKDAPVAMRFFNADGSPAAMCGNGLRCLGRFLYDQGATDSTIHVETAQRKLWVRKESEGHFTAFLGAARALCLHHPITHDLIVHCVDTGVPHAVLFVNDLASIDIQKQGSFLRYHPTFAPEGTNVNFAHVLAPQKLDVRTYERGLEAETAACGTGSAAAAVIAASLLDWSPPIEVRTRQGSWLTVHFSKDPSGHIDDIAQTGPVDMIDSGTMSI